MSKTTNLLREQVKRFSAPLLALALIVLGGSFVLGHKNVNAATAAEDPITPINNSSIDPLLALDQATEAVASRVTPAVVNVAVTAKAHDEETQAQGPGQGGDDDDNPFSRFFGPGRQPGHGMQGEGQGQRQDRKSVV